MQLFKINIACRFFFLFLSGLCFSSAAFCQLAVAPNQTASVLVGALAAPGVVVINPTLTCPGVANGTFTSSGTLLAMSTGIVLTNGSAAATSGPEGALISTNLGAPGDAEVASLLPAGTTTYDACVLEFDVVPTGDSIGFNYQFGSEEYRTAVCSIFNDAFAFFISGPGIVGAQNIALVPGTNVPVEINSVNDGGLGTSGSPAHINCTSLGAGSPFTSYYLDNTGGTTLSYRGYTAKFRAVSAVTPCDTYHLKLAIVDAGNAIYDSGVFVEGGSLTTNSYVFNHADSNGNTINGTAHTIVKGCSPATITIDAAHADPVGETISLTFGGTAVNGIDVSTVASSVTLPPGSTSVSFNVQAIPTAPSGPKTFTIYLTGNCTGIIDSIQLNILDTPTASILTPDTSVCGGTNVLLRVSGTPGLAYSWSPGTGLSNPNIMQPTATITAPVSYTMTASMPGTTCSLISRTISFNLTGFTISMFTPDTSICNGQSVTLRVNGSDTLSYHWSPATGIDSPGIKDPIATPTATTTYLVTASAATGCTASTTVTIGVISANAFIATPDTAICLGAHVQVIAAGDPSLTYQWIPTAGIATSNVLDPLIIPDTSATYYLLGSIPGCTSIFDSIKIDVQPMPQVYMGGNRQVCQFDTIHINAFVTPRWYTHYIYNWSPATNLDNTTMSTVVFTAGDSTSLVLTVNTPVGLTTDSTCRTTDSIEVIVHPGNFATIRTDTSVCPHDSLQLNGTGGIAYAWHPAVYLSDSTAASPWLHAITSQAYSVIATSEYGCQDTLHFNVNVYPAAIIDLGDSVTIYPGESYQLSPVTNCVLFSWFPPAGLNNADIGNPIAMPTISTKYIVRGTTESGCSTLDSISVYVDPATLLAVPNAFTPGNGPNNFLKIIKRGEATLNYFRIYNRWGNKVYESTDIETGWDGTFNGTPQGFGVFVYELEAVTNTGRIFQQHGNITLLR